MFLRVVGVVKVHFEQGKVSTVGGMSLGCCMAVLSALVCVM